MATVHINDILLANLQMNTRAKSSMQEHIILYGNTSRPAWEMQLVLFPAPRAA